MNKKKAADDAKLLANRIALLKMEEKKAWKKIQETKRKAEQVLQVRQRNEEDNERRAAEREARENEAAERAAANAAARQAQARAAGEAGQLAAMKQAAEAQRLKEESARAALAITRQREAEAAKNSSIKEMIRRQKEEAEDRRAMVSDCRADTGVGGG